MLVPDVTDLKRSFINSSRSKAASMTLPATWPPADAGDRDFLGWADPRSPRRAYLVVGPDTLDELVALEIRLPSASAGPRRQSMCDICQTSDAPDGSLLVVAPRAGARGRNGDSVGIYLCSDFGCSARARQPLKDHQRPAQGTPDTRVPDLVERVVAFVERVRG